MSPVSLALILSGVLLNAVAQLLLKAGTNAIGHFEFSADNVVPVGLRLAFEPHILGGVACYVAENPLYCVAKGTGLALEHIDFFRRSLVAAP